MRFLGDFSVVAAFVILICNAKAATNSTINSQVRLAYAGDHGMMVSWNTFSHIKEPTVRYGYSPNTLVYSASSRTSVTYNTSLTYNNHVKITGLKSDTTYYYWPDCLLQDNSTAAPYSFRTSRRAGDGQPYSIAVSIDMGTVGPKGLTTSAGTGVSFSNILGPHDNNTIQSLAAVIDQYDFLWQRKTNNRYPQNGRLLTIVAGDFAYADAWLKEEIQGFLPNTTIAEGYEVYESILNDFYDEMTPITTVKPYMVGPGNHEANCDAGGIKDGSITYNASICMPGQSNFTGFINHFRMPSKESRGTGNFWYSFDHGMVHYIKLDTETDLGHGFIGPDEVGGVEGDDSGPFNSIIDAQTAWLEADLASVDRDLTPWIIVAGHRPWYLSFANVSTTVCWSCKDVFEPLLIKYNVDLYLSGHSHVYQRSAPLANGIIDPNELNNPSSPWYITNGAAGHYDGLGTLASPKPYQRFGLDTRNATYGWSKLTFHNCTHLTHEFVASKNGSVLDTATLFKNRTCTVQSRTYERDTATGTWGMD
jgi:hypothetical protein